MGRGFARTISLLAVLFFFVISMWGCATINSMMPTEKKVTVSPWKNYEEAETAFKSIMPGKTTLEELQKTGFNPKSPNVTSLDPLTIRKLFLGTDSNSGLKIEDLPPLIQEYLRDFENCKGYQYKYSAILSKGEGNILWRFLGIKKEDRVTGWEFEAFIFVKKDKVIYVTWRGTPNINQIQDHRDYVTPLGNVVIGAPSRFILK